MDTPSLIGSVLGGRYLIRSLVGSGGMGAVYMAEHQVLQRRFAVKVLRRELADDPRLLRRFQREARAASRIQHPNIVFISDFGTTDDGSLYLVMEYIPGRTLRDELSEHGRMPMVRALKLLLQVVDAVDCAHRAQVIHRDLKPENLLITEHRGRPDFVKVLDFGVAKIVAKQDVLASQLSIAGELYGTPLYMAPEQFSGKEVGPHTDVYAIGIVAYEMVTGAPPFGGSIAELLLAHSRTVPDPPSRRAPGAGISPAFDAIVTRCLAKAAGDRYASAAELGSALQGLYRVATGKAQLRAKPDDTDFSSPLRRFAFFEESQTGAPERTSSEIAMYTPGGASVDGFAERTLRDLAEGLRDEGLGSPELTVVLTRLAQTEERVYAEQADIALCEAQIAETDQTIDERAGRLRYALIQISQERARLTAPAALAVASTLAGRASDPIADLDEQASELEKRLAELEVERSDRVAALDSRLVAHRATLGTWEGRQRADEQRLVSMVEMARGSVKKLELMRLYDRLDELRRAKRGR